MRFKVWLTALLIPGLFALGGGCGSQPEIVNIPGIQALLDSGTRPPDPDATVIDLTDAGCKSPSCAELGTNCGAVTDHKCGGVIDCGTCPSGEACGAAGPNVCGRGTGNGAGACVAKTCAELGADCGPVSDGCSGLLRCGTCSNANSCGVNGAPNVCGVPSGDGGTCTPLTCAEQNLSCGPAGDGCGNELDCGGCSGGQSCGGAGTPGVCGAPTCTPLTCAEQNVACGPAGDGCGQSVSCGSCGAPKICGGGGVPGQCGCTGVCSQIAHCQGSATTTLTGTVYDPAGKNPLYHVLVYVPNNPSDPALRTFAPGITCDQCGATAAGDPLVTTYTAPNGTFTLSNVPVGQRISVVIQLGRWRRVFQLDIPNACTRNAVPDKTLRMPSQKSQGNIPLMAMVTGHADSIECVLRKMGIADSEFTDPSGGGRVQFYLGSDQNNGGKSGSYIDSRTPNQSALFQRVNGVPVLNAYDMAIFACQGDAYPQSAANQAALLAYANGGGRVFATHYSYTWLNRNGKFANTAAWHVDENDRPNSTTGSIDMLSNPKAAPFQQWLEAVGASSVGSGTVPVVVVRHDTDSVLGPTQQWLYRTGSGNYAGTKLPLHFTFNTPVDADSAHQCGRVLFSDFHVDDAKENGIQFPRQCDDRPMNAQEKLLEFMIFDLGACVQPYTPVCTPRTCASQGIECGPAGDGCGNPLDCGACRSGQFCGGGGPGKCGVPSCTKLTCNSQGMECGPAGDGCGNALNCGACAAGQVCGGGGRPGVCGSDPCTPRTCADQHLACGPAGDGCGRALNCGSCPSGMSCGAGGPSQCGTPSCVPQSCAVQGIECGPAGDGCGNQVDCGNCGTGEICGAGGVGKCGGVAR